MDKKNVLVGSLTAILTTIIILGGVAITDDNVYYCEARSLVMSCDSLSTYYQLDNGKCWNTEVGNKLCRSGWMKITKDTSVEVVPEEIIRQKELCSPQGCVPIN